MEAHQGPEMAGADHWSYSYPAMGRDVETASLDSSSHLEKSQAPAVEWKPGRSEYAVMLTLAVISLMVALDATILVSVLPTLAVDLGGSSTDAFWAGTSYLLACAVCQPFIAALSDIFGRRSMLFTSVVLFTVGTLLCAPIAKNFAVFFFGRAVQGIGGGGIITMGQVIFADIVPLRQRPKYFSLVLAAWAVGSVLGPLVGGLFAEHVAWEWCFYINLPFCAIGIVLVPIFVKLSTADSSLAEKLGRVDWIGGFLFIGGLTSLLIGISWAGVQYAWSSAQTIAPLVLGAAGVVAAIFWEIYGAREPFLRPSLFYSPSALATYACAMFQGFILFCALYYVPFYFTSVQFHGPAQSGLDLLPVSVFLLPGSIIISVLTSRLGRYRWAIWSGWVVTAIGCGLLVLLDADTKTPVWAVILAIYGIGSGMVLTSVNIGVQAVSRVEDAGRAAAMYAFMRTLGMSIGVAVGGTVFQNVMSHKLRELGLPEEIAHNSEAFVTLLAKMDPADPARIAAVQAYLAGFHGVFWMITAAALASLLISLIIKRHSMDKLLDSQFTLKGGRASNAAGMAGAYTAVGHGYESGQDPNGSKYASVQSFTSQVSEVESTFSYVKPLRTATLEGYESYRSPVAATAPEQPAVAYYIQPGGKIVPVDILSERGTRAQVVSMTAVEEPKYQSVAVPMDMSQGYYSGMGFVQGQWEAGQPLSDASQHQAGVAPVWIPER